MNQSWYAWPGGHRLEPVAVHDGAVLLAVPEELDAGLGVAAGGELEELDAGLEDRVERGLPLGELLLGLGQRPLARGELGLDRGQPAPRRHQARAEADGEQQAGREREPRRPATARGRLARGIGSFRDLSAVALASTRSRSVLERAPPRVPPAPAGPPPHGTRPPRAAPPAMWRGTPRTGGPRRPGARRARRRRRGPAASPGPGRSCATLEVEGAQAFAQLLHAEPHPRLHRARAAPAAARRSPTATAPRSRPARSPARCGGLSGSSACCTCRRRSS